MHSQSTGALARYIEKTGKECLMPTGQHLKKKKTTGRHSPAGTVAKPPCSQSRQLGSDRWSGS